MEVTVEQSGTCEATVALTVPWDEFQGQVERVLRQQSRSVRMKGFRAGKVPLAVLEKQFGEKARQESVEHFLNQGLQKAVEEHRIEPVGQQQIEVEKVNLEQGQRLEATFQISLRPRIELAEYKGLEIESELEPVLDQELEATLADLRAQRSRLEPVGPEGLPADGMAVCKVRFEKDGEVVFEREGLRFGPRTPPEGLDPEEFERALTGAQAGDERRLALRLPDDFDRPELRGQEAVCVLEFEEVHRIVPPTDEELQALLEAETWESFLTLARERIGVVKQQREEARVEGALLERLLKEHSFDLPERMVARQLQARERQLRKELEGQGLEEAQIEREVESQRAELQRATEHGIRAFFLVHAIAEAEDVKVTQKDLTQELQHIAQRNETSFEEVRDYYVKNRLVEQVGLELLERKVRTLLREHARIVQPA